MKNSLIKAATANFAEKYLKVYSFDSKNFILNLNNEYGFSFAYRLVYFSHNDRTTLSVHLIVLNRPLAEKMRVAKKATKIPLYKVKGIDTKEIIGIFPVRSLSDNYKVENEDQLEARLIFIISEIENCYERTFSKVENACDLNSALMDENIYYGPAGLYHHIFLNFQCKGISAFDEIGDSQPIMISELIKYLISTSS